MLFVGDEVRVNGSQLLSQPLPGSLPLLSVPGSRVYSGNLPLRVPLLKAPGGAVNEVSYSSPRADPFDRSPW